MSAKRLLPLLVVAPLTIAAACTSSDTQVAITYAPGFAPGAAQVSILGVYHEGRLAESMWDEMAPEISRAFGSTSCEAAYGKRMRAEAPETMTVVEREAKDHGVTEALMEPMTAHAQGALVLVLDVWGTAGTRKPNAQGAAAMNGQAAPPAYGGNTPGVGFRPGGGSRLPPSPANDKTPGSLEIVASFYSVAQHEFVAAQKLRYEGDDPKGAVRTFANELAKTLPGATCTGWKFVKGAPVPAASTSAMPATTPSAAPAASATAN
jgi:hypothetical protein